MIPARWIPTFALLLFQLGCGGTDTRSAQVTATVTDSAGVTVIRIAGPPSELPSWVTSAQPTLEIDGDEPPFLGSIGEVAVLSDGALVLVDNQTSRLHLVRDGEVRTIAGEGDGPGEFRNLVSLSVMEGDSIVAFDRIHQRLTKFDSAGVFVSTIPLTGDLAADGTIPHEAWGLDGDRFLLHAIGAGDPDATVGPIRRDQRDAILYEVSGDGRTEDAGIQFTGGYEIDRESIRILAPFSNAPIVDAAAGRVLFGSGIELDIVVATTRLEPLRVIRWPGWREPLTSSLGDSVRTAIEAVFAGLPARSPMSADRTLEAIFSEGVLPDTLPGLGDAFFDDQGRIWATPFSPITNPWNRSHEWYVFDRDGLPIGQLVLPSGSRLAAVRDGRAVVIRRDARDVQHIRVVELAPADGKS